MHNTTHYLLSKEVKNELQFKSDWKNPENDVKHFRCAAHLACLKHLDHHRLEPDSRSRSFYQRASRFRGATLIELDEFWPLISELSRPNGAKKSSFQQNLERFGGVRYLKLEAIGARPAHSTPLGLGGFVGEKFRKLQRNHRSWQALRDCWTASPN